MPTTEECALGAENRANIKNLRADFVDFRDEVRASTLRIESSIDKISNHFSKRAPWLIVLLITFLTSMLSTLITYIIMAK